MRKGQGISTAEALDDGNSAEQVTDLFTKNVLL